IRSGVVTRSWSTSGVPISLRADGGATMRDPRDLYRFESTEVLEAVPRTGLTLVHALPGMVDAGNACRIASTYLRDELRHLRLVSFETDELVDYRGARPHATFDGTS